jgi:hypothetical protein
MQMESLADLPPDIKAKVTLLEQHRQTIESLSQECERLERELMQYHASVAPIRKFPQEILLEIFRFYLSENPRLIRRLGLVCKSWYLIVINAPTLWTQIPILIDTREVDAREVARSIAPRIDACFRYSGNLLWDIDINMEHMVSIRGFLKTQERVIQDRIGTALSPSLDASFGGGYSTIVAGCTGMSWNPAHLHRLLGRLTGEDGDKMERWGSATLRLPADLEPDLRDPILLSLTGSTSHLTRLEIISEYWNFFSYPRIFPVLSSLKHLKIQPTFLMRALDIVPTQIEHLTLPCIGYNSLVELAEFTSLRSLKLLGKLYSYNSDDVENYESRSETLSFPMLRHICFEGPAASTKGVQFNVPLLKHVSFERCYEDEVVYLPELDPKAVSWVIHSDSRECWRPSDKRAALSKILSEYRSLEEITVSELDHSDLIQVIGELQRTGTLPSSLTRVHVVTETNWDMVVRTSTITAAAHGLDENTA